LNKTDEIFLLQKLKEGDIQVLEVIFNRYYSNLCRYLSLLFKNKIIVEHIAQDIFVYLWENRETLTINESFESYIFSAGKYKALNQIRNTKKQEAIQKSLDVGSAEEQPEVDIRLEKEELQNIIEKAVSLLPDRCQKIFRLSREEELTYREIAELLGVSVNTVEGQMAIAFKKLRTVLRPFYFRLFISL
jgi:RNA polymerase sigma-70 factor (family 1)